MRGYKWTAGSLFIGVDSNLIGIKVTHEGINDEDAWQKAGAQETVNKKDMYVIVIFMMLLLLMICVY